MNKPVFPADKPALRSTSELGITKQMTRVLHLINGEHFSGAERVQDLLGLSLGEFGYDVGFACLKSGLFPKKRSSTNPLFELNMRSKADFKAIRRLQKLVQESDFRVLHAHTPRTVMAGAMVARKLGCPLIYHVHSPVGRDSTRSISNRINQWVEAWAAKQVDHFVCVSDSVQEYMIEVGHPEQHISCVANGVRVVSDVENRATPSGTWTLGTTALFRPRKGTECLLESLAILKQRNLDVRLLAVGPFETRGYEDRIKVMASELGVADLIEWTGFVDDVNAEFRRMDAFVLPSLFGEGLPMVILEAMAVGTPVVAAEVEGVNLAIRSGKDGLIFPPGSPQRLASQVESLIDGTHDWQAIRNSAMQRQRTLFSDISMARGIASVYDQLLDGTR